MEKRKEGTPSLFRRPGAHSDSDPWLSLFYFLFSIFCAAGLAGCAAPGDPQPRRPPVPEAIADLSARQAGEGVVLTFTLPRVAADGRPLEETPAIEILREFRLVTASGGPPPAKQILEIPAALVDTYRAETAEGAGRGRVQIVDLLPGEDLARHAGELAVYVVRTRISRRYLSADSNIVAIRIYPVPEPIRTLRATVTESAIELNWEPPERTTSGSPIEAMGLYRIYRAEADAALVANPAEAKKKAALAMIGESPAPAYRDAQFEFDRTYLYVVRSVARYGTDSVESADSEPTLLVTPRDTFPPIPPQNLVAAPLPATSEAPAQIELSWSISAELDLAGYHIYRADSDTGPPQRLNRDLLLTPTFRDISVAVGRRYTYTVTAVDRAGNESPPSAAVPAAIPENRAPSATR